MENNFEKLVIKLGLRAEKTPTSEFEKTLGKLLTKRGHTAITNLTRTLAAGRGNFDTFDNEKINDLIGRALRSPKVLKMSEEERVGFKENLETYIRTGEVPVSPEKEAPVLYLDNPIQVPLQESVEVNPSPEGPDRAEINRRAEEFIKNMNAKSVSDTNDINK